MSKYERPPFSPSGEFVVRRGLRFAGRSYSPGEIFPWRRLACSPRKLRQLYESRYLQMKEDAFDQEATEPLGSLEEAKEVITEATKSPDLELTDEEETENGDEETEEATEEAEEVTEAAEAPVKKKKKKKKKREE